MKFDVVGENIYDIALYLADFATVEDVETQINSVNLHIHRGATPNQITAAYFAEMHARGEAYEDCEDAYALEAQGRLLRIQAAAKVARAVVHVPLDKGM